MSAVFDNYFAALTEAYRDGGTEHSGRTALENLLDGLKPDSAVIKHEPGRQWDKGAPDFKITRKGCILGYLENKAPGTNLDKVLKSDQIKRYKSLSDNLVVTDYLQWIWLRDGKIAARETLAYPSDLQGRSFTPTDEKIEATTKLLDGFFSADPEPVSSVEVLAERLAARGQLLRDALTQELTRQQKDNSGDRLIGLYGVFKNQVFHELSLKEFADAFAQMLAYSLFLAKLNAGANQSIDLHNVKGFIPVSFNLIRELSDFLDDIEGDSYVSIRWVIDEILSLINGLDLAAIQERLSFQHRRVRRGVEARDEEEARLFERDPYIYFYEDFLRRYDPKTRETRGVYYTPPPVVNFIVRAIDGILKDTFSISQGLAGHDRVTVLDFACGTGTFLVEVLERIFENTGGPDSGMADLVVKSHVLKNVYGFEFLLAPYTIAHLKLSQYLADKGHPLTGDERLGVFLTNTLEPMEPQKNWLLPELTHEVELAQEVKEKPILVITGNPPYSGHSRNKGAWISAAIDAYKRVDGRPLGEKNPKWLNDDYVKFIRFAQMKIDEVDEGVVGVITNHSFLDNPTFRGMRQSLMQSFDQIYVLDLHGNTKKREVSPDGSADMNVFDIQQGVAISIFVKSGGNAEAGSSTSSSAPSRPQEPGSRTEASGAPDQVRGGAGGGRYAQIFHADLWGKRLPKYKACAEATIESVNWEEIDLCSPYYFFKPFDCKEWRKYTELWPVTEIFPVNSVGIVTARDKLAIQFTKERMHEIVKDFAGLDAEAAREKYRLGRDVQDWKVHLAQADLNETGVDPDKIVPVTYRPFDCRFTYFTGKARGFVCRPRGDVMRHMLRENVGLQTIRSMDIQRGWEHALVCDGLMTHHTVSMKEVNYLFPLYLYPSDDTPRTENISLDFREWLDGRYDHHFSPEQIMGYIYAVLHASAYREKYAEFLRIDFPRIPFPQSLENFNALAALGWDLMQAHLMRDVPAPGLGAYKGRGNHEVEKPRYSPGEQAVYINETQHFAPVPQEVWDFHIGGYQVIDKYLKSRKGRTLNLDEITNVTNICNVLAFTIKQMKKIDAAYAVAFGG